MRHIGDAERRARLGRRHHLAARAKVDDVTILAGDLVGLHGTDPATVFLSAAARLTRPATTLGNAPSIPATTMMTRADASRDHSARRRCSPATPTPRMTTRAALTGRRIARSSPQAIGVRGSKVPSSARTLWASCS
jgi:hypothetical protein